MDNTELPLGVMSNMSMDNQYSKWAEELLDLKGIELKKILQPFSPLPPLFILLEHNMC